MGLLDDAIREHLELKRRRGADPAEVERLEREALGPARRGPEAAEAVLGEANREEVHGEEPYAAEPEGEWAQELEEPAEWEYEEPSEPETPEPSAESGPSGGREPIAGDLAAAGYREESIEEPPSEAEPPHSAPAPSPPAAPPPAGAAPARPAAPPPPPSRHHGEIGGDTVEYDVEAEHAEHVADDAMLEETPEFLQDTPDHDRLWFEQRPPKDFDFDK